MTQRLLRRRPNHGRRRSGYRPESDAPFASPRPLMARIGTTNSGASERTRPVPCPAGPTDIFAVIVVKIIALMFIQYQCLLCRQGHSPDPRIPRAKISTPALTGWQRSQGGVKFPTGGIREHFAAARERPANAQVMGGSADLVRCQSRRSESG